MRRPCDQAACRLVGKMVVSIGAKASQRDVSARLVCDMHRGSALTRTLTEPMAANWYSERSCTKERKPRNTVSGREPQ